MSILETIVNYKRKEVRASKSIMSIQQMRRHANFISLPPRSFSQAIKDSPSGIISEFKRRSPSKGEIHPMADVESIIEGYTKAGAACCSVLTDSAFFGGSLSDFSVARAATHLPLLRKDFIIDEYQIYQARCYHADAILLIAAILTANEISNFIRIAHGLNMQTLLEVHNERELDKFDPATDMVGINNRNLHDFATDIEASCLLIERLPRPTVKISESGISSPKQVALLRDAGFDGFLIGEKFMKEENPGMALKLFVDEI